MNKVFLLFITVPPLSLWGFRTVPPFQARVWAQKGIKIKMYSHRFAQGDAIYVWLKAKFCKKAALSFFQKKYRLKARSQGIFDGIIAIPPRAKTGRVRLKVRCRPKGAWVFPIPVYKAKFIVKRISKVRVSRQFTQPSKKQLRIIRRQGKIKKDLLKIETPRKWEGRFIDPREWASMTSPFFIQRIYNNKPGHPHSGVDLKGAVGDPVRAIANGKVVLSRRFYYEGNWIVLDHGDGILSYYMHLDRNLVREGMLVQKGQLIGYVGQTGMVTGPHLHLSVRVKGVLVSPLSLLALPIPHP